ncbi:hypothetical protein V2H45_10720 [Tumidithrix elongata RA019]|uniref:Uncharacterized protein n=1 Tax=Tumidithrix elongata BACA0141 TaxID=2716417 RepID=A0AAW9Q1A3_9CYAN|nr:hypothetical protein [Tumidithrix elongata RA019]
MISNGGAGCVIDYSNYIDRSPKLSSPSTPSTYIYSPPRDREAEKLEADVISLKKSAIEQARLLHDPEYIRYLTGKWIFPSSKGAKNGEFCTAFFSRQGVILTLGGPGGDYKGASLTFMSADIPRPKKTEVVKVTLLQNDEPPITVNALNYSNPNHSFGSIVVALTAIDPVLTSMEDFQHFDLQIDGKSIAKIDWHSGLAARDELSKCLNGKPYSVTQIDLLGK